MYICFYTEKQDDDCFHMSVCVRFLRLNKTQPKKKCCINLIDLSPLWFPCKVKNLINMIALYATYRAHTNTTIQFSGSGSVQCYRSLRANCTEWNTSFT